MPGYTHLQHAQPVLLSHHLLAYFEMLARDADRLGDCRRRTNVLPLGSGALAGVGFPVDRQFVAERLGFEAVAANSMDAVSDRDFVLDFLSAAATCLVHLSRLAEELVLWSSQEFGFVQLDEAWSTGSSIMPQKRNPDCAELIRGKTGRVFGSLMGMLAALKGLPLAYNKDLQEDKEALFDAADTLRTCLEAMAAMVETARFDPERMRAALSGDFSAATEAADYLVRKGIPFREAHRIVGELVRRCEERGCDLPDLPLEEWQKASDAFAPDILDHLTPEAAVLAKSAPGGTSPERVREALGEARGRMGVMRHQ